MDDSKAAEIEGLRAEFLRSRQAYHDARGRMLVAHLPWLEVVVGRERLPPRVRRDEVKSEAGLAMLGVLDAYDPNRGPLIAYAKIRLVGAIGDWVRRSRVTRAQFSLDELATERD
jgi:hypothetical protein